MKKIWVVASKDIREALRSRGTYLYIVILIVLSLTYSSSYNSLMNTLVRQNASQQVIYETSRVFLNSLAYTLPLIYAFLIAGIFAAYSVVMDKVRRNLESLMATPLSLKQIWIGKTLGVTLPSVVISIGISIVAYIIMNFVLIIPRTGSFILIEPSAIITVLILVPMLIFSVALLVIYLQLVISNPRIANLAFTGIFLLFFFGSTFLTQMGYNVPFYYIYLGLIVICTGVSYLISGSLTRERVLLSSKT